MIVRIASDERIGGFVTTSDSSAEATQRLVDGGATAGVVTVDPGRLVVMRRLGLSDDASDDDDAAAQCRAAVGRWYGG